MLDSAAGMMTSDSNSGSRDKQCYRNVSWRKRGPAQLLENLVQLAARHTRSAPNVKRSSRAGPGCRSGVIGRPEEVAAAVIFLMNNGFVTCGRLAEGL
jgi:hypothetical protein